MAAQSNYPDITDYGILCNIQDLGIIVKNLDKFMKKNKIRSQGIGKDLGWKAGIRVNGSIEERFCEWRLSAGYLKAALPIELGYTWHFEVCPNRQYRIDRDNTATEVYAFPDRKDISIYFTLIKHNYDLDNAETRKVRELFFRQLLDSIGFPYVELYHYAKGEERRA